MEEKKDLMGKAALEDDMLDNVAGGSGESSYRWNEGEEVKFKYSWRCVGCNTLGSYAVIEEITLRNYSLTYGLVRFKCCGRT